jgi:hypothetical protein
MEIDTKMNWGTVNGLPPVKNSTTVPSPTVPGDSFADSTALVGALQDTPDVRPEAVANGRELINNGNYPSNETVKKLSNFLASQLPASLD